MDRGDVFLVDLNQAMGAEIGGIRPVVVISNNNENRFTPTVLVAPITSRVSENLLPTHSKIKAGQGGLKVGGVILLEQIKAIDKSRLTNKIGSINKDIFAKIVESLQVSLGVKESAYPNIEADDIENDSDSNNLIDEYDKFYDLIEKQTKTIEILHKDFISSGSYSNKFKEWILSGIIGAILGVLASFILKL